MRYQRFDVSVLENPHAERLSIMQGILTPIFARAWQWDHRNLFAQWMKEFLQTLTGNNFSILDTVDRFPGQCGTWSYALKTWGLIMRSSDEEIRASIDSVEKRKDSTLWASESLENILLMLRTEQEIRERWTSVAPELSQQVAHNTERVLRQAPESEELTIRRVLGEYDDLWGSICNFAEINLGNSNLPPAELLGRLIDAQRSKVGNDYFDPLPLSNLKKENEVQKIYSLLP